MRLNEALVIVGLGEFERTGEVVMIKDRIGTDRLVVLMSNDEEKVVRSRNHWPTSGCGSAA